MIEDKPTKEADGIAPNRKDASDTYIAPRPQVGRLSLREVGKIYDPEGASIVALQNCNMEVNAGDFVAIVGPSGCGKSTLMNIIAGFDSVSDGEILLDGKPLATPTLEPRPGADRVVVFQNGALFPWKTVVDNVSYGPIVQGLMSRDEAQEKALQLLKNSGGLDTVAQSYPLQLSSGMQRRVEIVRALMNDPKILLLDEPFRAMDTVSKTTMHNHLLRMFRELRRTVIFITHDLEEAIYLSDKVMIMTSRPGTIKKSLEVSLPRPRRREMLASEAYLELKRQLSAMLHHEARNAFDLGEREMA